MKKLRVVFISVVLCVLMICSFAYADTSTDYNVDGIESTPFVQMSAEMVGNDVKVKIQNNSDDVIHNVHLISEPTNRLVSSENCIKLEDIEAGKSSVVTLDLRNLGKGFFRDYVNSIGGSFNFFLLLAIIIPCVLVIIWICTSRCKGKLKKSETAFYICIVSVLILISIIFVYNRIPKYVQSKVGINYSNIIDVNTDNDYSTLLTLKYNKDEVKYDIKEVEEEIDFDVVYEYDDSIPCVDEPIVKTEGEVGKKKIITITEYRNGKQTNVEKSEKILVEPKEQIEVQGTKTTVEIENIEAGKTYIPDDTLRVGEYALDTELAKSKDNIGKKEVTYTWDNSEKKVVSEDKVLKEPGVNTWRAGTLVVEEELVKAETKYVAVKDKPVGWENVISESIDGNKTTIYKTDINTETGKPVKDAELRYFKAFETKPINGEKEIGVLKTEEVVTSRELEYKEDDTKWDNEEIVESEGQDKIEKVVNIMKLNVRTGSISDVVEKEVSREVVQKDIPKLVVRGIKKPNWVEEKKAADQVKYNTVYIPDESLTGDEQVVVTKGQMGRLVTTQLVAVDENGNKISSYKPKIIEEDSLQKPVDEVIKVAPDSKLLK